MSSRSRSAFAIRRALAISVTLMLSACTANAKAPLRICADPDNMPYSNRALQGFDNRIAIDIAHALGRTPVFIWSRARRGFVRREFNGGACDVLTGVPVGMRAVLTTNPYYRSSYMFVTRSSDHLHLASFEDPHLNGKRIGLQVMEEDYSPPSLPLIRSGHAAQFVGFPSFGDAAGNIVREVANKHIGLAVVWGPLAGYFALRQHGAISLTPVQPAVDASGIPFVFDIALGVRHKDIALRDELNSALMREAANIERTLQQYGVPLLKQKAGAS
jgi:mxaJ protein